MELDSKNEADFEKSNLLWQPNALRWTYKSGSSRQQTSASRCKQPPRIASAKFVWFNFWLANHLTVSSWHIKCTQFETMIPLQRILFAVLWKFTQRLPLALRALPRNQRNSSIWNQPFGHWPMVKQEHEQPKLKSILLLQTLIIFSTIVRLQFGRNLNRWQITCYTLGSTGKWSGSGSGFTCVNTTAVHLFARRRFESVPEESNATLWLCVQPPSAVIVLHSTVVFAQVGAVRLLRIIPMRRNLAYVQAACVWWGGIEDVAQESATDHIDQ